MWTWTKGPLATGELSPKMRVKNVAEPCLSRDGTMVWFNVIGIRRSTPFHADFLQHHIVADERLSRPHKCSVAPPAAHAPRARSQFTAVGGLAVWSRFRPRVTLVRFSACRGISLRSRLGRASRDR